MQLELGLEGQLDGEALHAAARTLIQRHSSLRASFRQESLSRPIQIIAPRVTLPWRRIDLSLMDDITRTENLARILSDERAERFDLASPPLIRFALVRSLPDRHRLVLTNHHILMDGWSMPVLVQELLTLYAHVSGRHVGDVDAENAAALPRVTPYRDYLAWIAAQDRSTALAAWRDALAGLDEATRIAPRVAKQRSSAAPEQIALSLSAPLTAALTQQARAQGLTLNSLVQAAWAILLGRLTGRDDVVFGVTVAGRPPEITGIERMVGLFINTLPLRVKLPPSQPLIALLQQVQDSQSRLMAHQHLGLSEIQSITGLGELFDTLFVFENYPVDRDTLTAEIGGLRLTDIGGLDATHYPLSLAVAPGEQLRLRLSYRGDLLERATVEATAQRLVRLLEAAVADAAQPIGTLDILSPEERRTIVRAWNDTARAIPSSTVPELIAAQVRKTPNATAVVSGKQTLTYGELDAHSSQLAHHLRARVGPEVVVDCASSARPRCWLPCSASSRPAAPTCRSTPAIRLSASLSCWPTPARGAGRPCPARATARASRAARLPRCRLGRTARQPANAPKAPAAATSGLVIHLGLTGTEGVVVEHASLANKLTLDRTERRPALPVGAAHFVRLRCGDRADAASFIGGGPRSSSAMLRESRAILGSAIKAGVTFVSCVPSYLNPSFRARTDPCGIWRWVASFHGRAATEISRRLDVAHVINLTARPKPPSTPSAFRRRHASRFARSDRPPVSQLSRLCSGRRPAARACRCWVSSTSRSGSGARLSGRGS